MSRYLDFAEVTEIHQDTPDASKFDEFRDAVYFFGISLLLFSVIEIYVLLRDQGITEEGKIGLIPIYAFAIIMTGPFILTLNENHLETPYLVFVLCINVVSMLPVSIYLFYSSTSLSVSSIYDYLELPVFLGANLMIFSLMFVLLIRPSIRKHAKIIQIYFTIYLIAAIRSTYY